MIDSHDWNPHARRLADFLAGEGLVDEAWSEVFAAVPRHEFVVVGDRADIDDAAVTGPYQSRGELLREAYADQVLVTRWETVDGERTATSSASQPTIVAIMLRLLAVNDGCRVLEIGTGPGYNASLLCVRLGDDRVTSVDIQSDVVTEAGQRLTRLGFHPWLETGDGALGCGSRAPFDRIIATCGLPRIPPAWLEQLAAGARVVAPMNFGGTMAVLDRRPDGTLSGRFPADAGFFMELRGPGSYAGTVAVEGPERVITSSVDPSDLEDLDFRLWLELWVPGVQLRPTRTIGGRVVGLRITAPGSIVNIELNDPVRVTERGQPVWDAIETAVHAWHAHRRPDRTRMGLTVEGDRQWVWLDTEDSDISWRL